MKKSEIVQTRLTAEAAQWYAREAERRGYTVAAFIRWVLEDYRRGWTESGSQAVSEAVGAVGADQPDVEAAYRVAEGGEADGAEDAGTEENGGENSAEYDRLPRMREEGF